MMKKSRQNAVNSIRNIVRNQTISNQFFFTCLVQTFLGAFRCFQALYIQTVLGMIYAIVGATYLGVFQVIVRMTYLGVFRCQLGGCREYNNVHLNIYCRRRQRNVVLSPLPIEVFRSKDHGVILNVIFLYRGGTKHDCTIRYRTVRYSSLSYFTVQYRTVPYRTILKGYGVVRYNTVLYCTVRYYTVT